MNLKKKNLIKIKSYIQNRLPDGWKIKEFGKFFGWETDAGIGKEEGKDDWDYQDGVAWTSRCAIYCESCKAFIGRWMVPMRYKAWCKKCVT
ncbi:MAG: hypothetical protein A2W46_06320 [Alphaproteobacteria bacterium RIFCSPHIGHO2_12_42_13]|nr:MAG: hypothetical protein A2W46_06320 [Alphaproteobacteria bacterium RIFCSPHIGHO2_12_42_13]